jgi:hypothetical protein
MAIGAKSSMRVPSGRVRRISSPPALMAKLVCSWLPLVTAGRFLLEAQTTRNSPAWIVTSPKVHLKGLDALSERPQPARSTASAPEFQISTQSE